MFQQTMKRVSRRAEWGWLLVMVLCQAHSQTSVAADPSFTTGSGDAIIDFINQQIRQGWQDNDVQPSPVAEDAEWCRRVYLDLVGHIPPLEELEAFLQDKDKNKRAKLIDRLLEDPGYVRHWTTIWTNLCIGQQTPRFVSRAGMQKFFREAFARNRPWKDVVIDLITAEGHYERNGAVNYILAQLPQNNNDDGVQLTAMTARLFLGMQVQCTQCHNHPFNEWKQEQFWQFNSFFRQTGRRDHRKFNPQTGRLEDDYAEVVWRDFEGPVYFEKRNGLVQVAFPIYNGVEVSADASTDRRKEFARLITSGERPQIALAMVNRMWGHFFSFGFTRPVDDMGPHNPPSHPELLQRLADEFIKSGYDLKQLFRWICNSEAYHLTSRMTAKNHQDNPAAGETPLFSHMYVKPMTAEQLYDSLIVATNAHKSGRSGWEQAERQRQEWMQQFVRAFGNDMAEETNSFDGTIPQALMMMNTNPRPQGDQPTLMSGAVSLESGSHLHELLTGPGTETQKIQKLFLTALSRYPTRNELQKMQTIMRTYRDPRAAYQDLFWALLNSNEFIFVH
ncbi:MAG: hypothetical protein KatS3mg114_1219 [Planctomycetaceae bacterium]|nr:MAG: hypothetical protein KatS3mg114_1219 [Planctomycetaceae bacterium]